MDKDEKNIERNTLDSIMKMKIIITSEGGKHDENS
jgi:hypothetical protein